jgi:hypothetical protein
MVQIKNQVQDNGNVRFTATGGDFLELCVADGASVVEIKAKDSDIYDGLLKTAVAYAFKRGIKFDEKPELKPTLCESSRKNQREVTVTVNDVDYDVIVEE